MPFKGLKYAFAKKSRLANNRRRVPRSRRLPKKGIAKIVRRVLDSQLEVKVGEPHTDGFAPILPWDYNGAATISSVFNLTSAMNNIVQGVAEGERIGNHIRPKRFIFTGAMTRRAAAISGTNTRWYKPAYVKMIILKQRNTLIAPTTMTDFFEFGPIDVPPTNLLSDLQRKVNDDHWQVYATRTFKIGGAEPSTSGAPITSADANNDFKLSSLFKVDLTKSLPKKIRYNDAGQSPQNAAMYALFIVAAADNVVPTNGNYPEVVMEGVVTLSYTDA